MSSLKEQLIKLGSTNPELRPHIKPVLAAVQGKTSAMYNYDGLVRTLAEIAENEGKYYSKRDAKGAVEDAAKQLSAQLLRDVREAKRDAIKEVERVWGAWDKQSSKEAGLHRDMLRVWDKHRDVRSLTKNMLNVTSGMHATDVVAMEKDLVLSLQEVADKLGGLISAPPRGSEDRAVKDAIQNAIDYMYTGDTRYKKDAAAVLSSYAYRLIAMVSGEVMSKTSVTARSLSDLEVFILKDIKVTGKSTYTPQKYEPMWSRKEAAQAAQRLLKEGYFEMEGPRDVYADLTAKGEKALRAAR